MHEPVLRPPTGTPVISLIGMPGSGKTSIGRRLARHLEIPFVDLDRAVEERAGRSIAELFADAGEGAFRQLEAEALTRAVGAGPAVVATGGGAVLSEANRAVLRRDTVTVYLAADVAQLWRRIQHGSRRPLLATSDPYATLCELFERRRPLYAELALVTVDTGDGAAPLVVQRIVAALKQHHGWAAATA